MSIYLEEKEEKNYQAFMDELEKISKKYGIAFEGCGVFAFCDENGFKSIKYRTRFLKDRVIKWIIESSTNGNIQE